VPEIIGKVADFLQKQFDDRGLTLTLDVPSDLPQVFGDPDRITQVITNLLSNAYKYTAEGGVTVLARQVENFLQVDVSDTGVGISAEDQEKLFSRFFRAEDDFVRAQSGTGLGLNITQSLVEMHEGRIWVESEPGVGSTFSFTLPLPATQLGTEIPGDEQVAAPLVATPSSSPHILVVDDAPDIAHLFQYQLEKEGYRTTVVTQGSQVVEVTRQLHPDLITLDLVMDVDGLTILQKLKADPETAGIPVVIVSVLPHPEEGLALGATDYLVKPLDEEELLTSVRRVLGKLDDDSLPKILVVDDEPDIVGWLKHALTHHSYHVTAAYDGVQALEAVAADVPDLILLDLKMPRMDGRTTIRRLREQEGTRHIPIIVLTASQLSDEWERAQILSMGVKELLHKPVTIEQLVAEVKKYLGGQ
jgi:CheY-like chemotaxis protein